MVILARDSILEYIKDGVIGIDPFVEEHVQAGSLDCHLGNTFRVFKQAREMVHINNESVDLDTITELIEVKDYLSLLPGQSVHGITQESITLPNTICGWIQGRSSLARMGLMVHITANFIQPGSRGRQVLEMMNAGPMPLAIHPGTKICQIIFEEVKGSALYKGKFVDQQHP